MNKKYWLRGGLISVIIVGIITLILFVFVPPKVDDMISAASVPVLIGFEYPVGVIFELLNTNTNFFWASRFGSNIMIIISVIDYFLFGMLIGWIYGKIKERRLIGTTMN